MIKIEDKEKIINENLENYEDQLIKNINLLNNFISKNSNEIDMNKLIVLLIEKFNINPFTNMKVKDVATDLGMNQNNANDLFRRKDFPAITFTKPKQICWLSYLLWKMERRI